MFRVAQIDTLQNIDLLADGGGKLIFGPRASEAQLLLSSFQKYLKGRDATFHAFYKNFTPQKSGLLDNIEEYGLIFVNDTKKQAILRNSLIYRLQAILLSNKEKCDAGCKKERSARISEVRSILTKADTLSPEFGKDLRSILQRYVLLGLTSTESRPTTYFAEGQSSIGELANMILSPSSGSTTRYRLLSEIFNEYVVAGGTRAQLDENMQGFIRILITGKTLEEADFLPLVFYINEYLSLKNDDIDSTALSMANSMVTLAGRYLETRNKKDEKFATLSVLFFTFSSLFERMHTHIGTRFFEGPEDRRVLKKEYQDESGARIDTDFINRYEELLLILEKFNENQKDFYLASLGSASTDTTNLFDQLTRILGLHKKTLTIWKDYRLYENNLNLSDESRNIQSIVISDMESSDTIIEYISTFTGVNPTKTRIINSPESDGHFIVETEIQGVPFQFRIRGKERFLENIEFTDIAGIKQNLR